MHSYILAASFTTVFAAELLGDRSLYSISSLVLRWSAIRVFIGISAAYMLKALVAVLFGSVLGALPSELLRVLSTVTLLTTAALLLVRDDETREETSRVGRVLTGNMLGGIAAPFAAIFLSEWADAGQLAMAALEARYHAPVTIWFGASLALIVKGTLVIVAGIGLRKYLPRHVLRVAAAGSCALVAILIAVGGAD